MVLEFDNGFVKYGDVKIGTYKDNIEEGYYQIEPFMPSVQLYGRPLTEAEQEARTTHSVAAKPIVKKNTSYINKLSTLITPGSSAEKDIKLNNIKPADKKPSYYSFTSSGSSSGK